MLALLAELRLARTQDLAHHLPGDSQFPACGNQSESAASIRMRMPPAAFLSERVWCSRPTGYAGGFSVWRNHFVPGRHVTDHQMRLFMKFRQTHTTAVAAAK
ncbi:MAG: hypothetical protein EOS57_00505, partial [Mesorhizobium sp.]